MLRHLKIVVVPLDLGPLYDAEPHAYEGGADFPHNLGGGVQSALGWTAAGEGDVQPVFLRGPQERGVVNLPRAGLQPRLEGFFGLVGQRPDPTALVNIQRGETPEHGGQAAAAPQVGDTPLLQGIEAVESRQLG